LFCARKEIQKRFIPPPSFLVVFVLISFTLLAPWYIPHSYLLYFLIIFLFVASCNFVLFISFLFSFGENWSLFWKGKLTSSSDTSPDSD